MYITANFHFLIKKSNLLISIMCMITDVWPSCHFGMSYSNAVAVHEHSIDMAQSEGFGNLK